MMVLPDTDHADAEDLAARLRRTVQTTCLRPDGSPLTITTGTAEAGPDVDAGGAARRRRPRPHERQGAAPGCRRPPPDAAA